MVWLARDVARIVSVDVALSDGAVHTPDDVLDLSIDCELAALADGFVAQK